MERGGNLIGVCGSPPLPGAPPLLVMFDAKPESAVMWTYERLMERTEPYCFQSDEQEDFATGLVIPAGWWMSERALTDIERIECLN